MKKRTFKQNYYTVQSPSELKLKDSQSGKTLACLVAGKATIIQAIGDYVEADGDFEIQAKRKDELSLKYITELKTDVSPLHNTSAYLIGKADGEYTVNLGIYKQAPYMLYNRANVTKVNLMAKSEPTGLSATFQNCTGLVEFNTALTLSELTSATSTFSGCTSLESIPDQITLESLSNGTGFFHNVPLVKLPLSLNLAALSNGTNMFSGAKLGEESVERLANVLPTYTSGDHPISIGIDAREEGSAWVDVRLDEIAAKGWTVSEVYN